MERADMERLEQAGFRIVTSKDLMPSQIIAFDPDNFVVRAPCEHCQAWIQLFPNANVAIATTLEDMYDWWHIDDAGEKTTMLCCIQPAGRGISFEWATPVPVKMPTPAPGTEGVEMVLIGLTDNPGAATFTVIEDE